MNYGNINQGEPGDSTGIGGIVPGPRGDPGLPGRPGVAVSIDKKEIFLKIIYFYFHFQGWPGPPGAPGLSGSIGPQGPSVSITITLRIQFKFILSFTGRTWNKRRFRISRIGWAHKLW